MNERGIANGLTAAELGMSDAQETMLKFLAACRDCDFDRARDLRELYLAQIGRYLDGLLSAYEHVHRGAREL